MKKFLLSLLTVAAAISASAEQASWSVTFATGTDNSQAAWTTASSLTAVCSEGAANLSAITKTSNASPASYGLKVGQNKNTGDITFAIAESAQVLPTKIEVLVSANKNPGNIPVIINGTTQEALTSSNTNASYKTYTLTGFTEPITSISFERGTPAKSTTSYQGFLFVKGFTVYYENGGGSETPTPETIAKPVITVSESNEVSISCETEGAAIYYTTTGDTPSANSTGYSTPFTPAESCTVKAIAIKGDSKSEVAEATVTIPEQPTAPKAIVVTYNGNPVDEDITMTEGSVLNISAESATAITIKEDGVEDIIIEGETATWTATGVAEHMITISASNEVGPAEDVVILVNVTEKPATPETFIHTLTAQTFAVKGTTYAAYNCSEGGISYNGFMNGAYPKGVTQSGQAPYFGIRNSNTSGNYGGIAVTANTDMAMATEVKISRFASQTTDRKAYVYGSNTPYETGKGINTDNTPAGSERIGEASLPSGEGATITLSKQYPYILILSDGALQMEGIDITWAKTAAPEEFAIPQVEHVGVLGEGGSVTFTFSHPEEGARFFIYHEETVPAAKGSRRAPAHDADVWVENTTGTHTVTTEGTFHIYATNADKSRKSEIQSFVVTNDSTTGINEISVESADVEWYDMSGRRVASPAKGVYIRKQGSTIKKYAF